MGLLVEDTAAILRGEREFLNALRKGPNNQDLLLSSETSHADFTKIRWLTVRSRFGMQNCKCRGFIGW